MKGKESKPTDLVFYVQGDRFGGALDAAARQFSEAYDAGQHPMEFVNSMRKKGELIMGVGHRVKSINNPDMRVTIIKVLTLQLGVILFPFEDLISVYFCVGCHYFLGVSTRTLSRYAVTRLRLGG